MKFSINTKKELTIFKLDERRLDAALAPELKSQFVVLIEAEKKRYLIIDLSQVDAMDSSGLGALLMAHRQTSAHNGFAAFIGVRGKVKDLIKMAGLDKQLNIFSSVQDVINSIETVETDDEEPEEADFEDDVELEKDILSQIEDIGGKVSPDEFDAPVGADDDRPEFPDDKPETDEEGDEDEDGKRKSKKAKPAKAAKPKAAGKKKK